MEALLEKAIDGLNLDRSDWQLVKFGDVAIQQKQKVDRENTDLTRYVKGEHMYSEDLHLREWGELKDEYLGPAFIRKFEEGDILYGSRRTYLRKVVIAPFDGITSNTTFVIRANKNVVDIRILPFIMMSEGFVQHSIRNSKGSVNPYVNWKDLSGYEFLLPPKNQQNQLAALLWAMDETIQNEKNLLVKMVSYKHAYRKSVFCGYDKKLLKSCHNIKGRKGWSVSAVSEVCHIENNLRKPISKEIRAGMQGEYPYYGPTSVLDNICEYRVEGKYVLIGEDGDHFLKYADWNMTQYVVGKFNVNNHAHILRGTEKCLTKWIFYSLQHRNVIPHITKQGATRYKLNKESLQNIPLLIPPIVEQHKLVKKFDTIENNLKEIKSKIAISTDFSRSLINQVF